MPDTDILNREQVAKVAETVEANYPLRLYLSRFGIDIDALCRTLRVAWESVTFWQAEALLNHFCSEHASNKRQGGHYCTICTKPFVMSVPQDERPPKYKDLITENTALREQLAEVEQLAETRSDLIAAKAAHVDQLQSKLAQVEKERDAYKMHVEAPIKEAVKGSLEFGNRAAARMRDLCVEKVKARRDQRRKDLHAFANDDNHKDEADYERAVLFVLDGVISDLESLTLDQVKEKQS